LAHHYTEAGITEQAVSYWEEAGQRATDPFAYAEAMAHFRKGLELLQAQPEAPERAQHELQLLLLLGPAIGVVQGLATSQREQYYARAHALSQQVGDVSQLAAAVFGLGQIHYARGELSHTQALGEQLLAQVGAQADPSILIKVHSLLAVMAHNLGELTKARRHAELGIAMYTEQASCNVLWHPGDFHPGMAAIWDSSWPGG
jgi:predicted ATPase